MVLNMKLPPLPLRRIARFIAVLAIAIAAGHLAQTLAARKPSSQAQAALKVPVGIVQLSAGAIDSGPVVPLAMPRRPHSVDPLPIAASATPVCATQLTLQAEAGAMIGLSLQAPCHGAEQVVLRHAGLAVTLKTGADGSLATALPALTGSAVVEVMFGDGTKVQGVVAVPELATLRRFGVQWQGGDAFAVHGFQNGADFGQPGDISAGNIGAVGAGFLTVLGDSAEENPLLAQIYTYPANPAITADVVIEAEVTAASCGHDLLAETLASANGQVAMTDLTLAMPDCSGIGDFLVLKNLASDVKIAAN